MLLSRAGELPLLREIRNRFGFLPGIRDSGVIVGIGDDAAVIDPQGGKVLVTTDTMNEGVHFNLDFTSPFQLGFKLVSVNVSDIMAMCGRPRYLFLNLSLRKDADEEFFFRLYDGIAKAMDLYGVRLLGGDLTAAQNDMALSATVLGIADRVVTRGGAAPGDGIYVTAPTGDSSCGLEILKRLTPASRETIRRFFENGKEEDLEEIEVLRLTGSPVSELSWKIAGPLIRRHLMPSARDSAALLAHATSLIDISDGLFIDLCRVCDESGAGARLYRDWIPLSAQLKSACEALGLDAFTFASSGGEDYELLFTARPDIVVENAYCIGEITGSERVVVDGSGGETVLKAEGYQHFGAQG